MRWVAGALGVSVVAVAISALGAGPGWWDEGSLQIRVHEHAFHRGTVNAVGCQVRVRLYFDAPASGYKEAAPERNHYRFRAEVKLSGGQRFVSDIFDNGEAGPRVFAFSHDTTSEGCWADTGRKLRKVDVHACRGQRCTPGAFE
jgi:hypothetical protein